MRTFSRRAALPLFAAAMLALALACVGDADSTDDGTPVATDSATAPTGGDGEQVLRVRLEGEPETLDPQRASDAASLSIVRNLNSGLLAVSPELDIQPQLAADVPTVENGGISEDGLTYTFTLRDGLKWSDGEPLVAQHFVDGARRLFEPGNQSPYADLFRMIDAAGKNDELAEALAAEVEGADLEALQREVVENLQVAAPDDQTVVYTLSRPSPVFLLLTTMWPLYPARADIVEQQGDAWTEPGNLVSSGPFMLSSWTHGQDLTLTRNPEWYAASDVRLETIDIDIIADAAVAFLAFQEGELDIVRLGPTELEQVRRDPELQEQFDAYAELSTTGFYFNVDDPALANADVRRALTGAFDREEYAESVREGQVLPAVAWIPPGMPGHDPEAGQQYADAIEESRQLLADAGYPEGEGLELEVLIAAVTVPQITAQWLEQQWEQNLGISVTINALEGAAYGAERAAGNFQVIMGGWGADYPDPHNWMPLFRTGSGLNAGNYSNAEYDELVDAAEVELDQDERLSLYQQAQEILMADAPFAPLYNGRRNVLVQPWVQGFVPSALEHNMPGDVYFWGISIDGRE
ncbi:MAG: hypothetical protein GEU80_00450 [Dehalococcoidia bacterium]|nr:hypothetical protein [Dehalococcoidia bacterium]